MSGLKSSNKGKNYERVIAKRLSDWCGFELIRTPMSGAWPGTAGDILPRDRLQPFPFFIECKREEAWTMEQILCGNGLFHTKWLPEIVQKIAKDESHGHAVKCFMLIFSRNHKPDFIAYPINAIPSGLGTQANVLALRGDPALDVYELDAFLCIYNYKLLLESLG